MPHKQNPVAAIVLLGHAKQAPHLYAALASAAEQELQRAAGAWHAEWLPLTHLLTLTTSASAWATRLLSGLRVDAAKMRVNLGLTHGLPLAERVAGLLAPRLADFKLIPSLSGLALALLLTGFRWLRLLAPTKKAGRSLLRAISAGLSSTRR